MTSVRRLGKNTILYALGTFCQRVASLLLVPVYTSALEVSEYGALETLNVMVQTLTIVANLGLSTALLRFYAESEDEKDTLIMIRTSSVLVLVLSSCLLAVVLPFSKNLGALLFKDEAFGRFVVIALLWAIGGALNQQLLAYYRARQKARVYVALSVGIFLALVILNISFIRLLKLGLLGALLGHLIVVWSVNLWLVAKFWQHGRTISLHWARKLLAFGCPLVFSMFGRLILNSADRYFLAYYHDLSEVGIYGLGYKVGIVAQMAIVMPFQLAWGPFVFARVAAGGERTTHDLSRVFTYLLLAFSIVGLGLFLFASETVAFLGTGKFAEAAQVIPYVLFAYLFNGDHYWAASLFHLTKKTALLSAIVLGMAGLNLLLNLVWIPRWGWVGAALATVVTIGGTGLLALLVGRRLYPVPLQGVRLAKLVVGVVLVITVSVSVPIPTGITGWLMRGGILLLLPILLLAMRFFEQEEIEFLVTLPGLLKRKAQLVFRKAA